MAIQVGAKELKYPLPNFAQLAAQQSAAAASSGGSASASAYGANRQFAANKMRVQADLANSAAERDYRAQSQMQEQGFRAVQNYIDRELGAQQNRYAQDAMAERQQAQFAQQKELQGQSQTFRQEQFERQVDAGYEKEIQSGKMELNPKQQQQLRELDDVGPKELGNFDAEQRAEFEQQRAAKRREIIRSAQPSQGASVFNKGTTYVDEETGIGYNDPDAVPGKKLVPYSTADRTPLVDKSSELKQQQAEEKERIKQQKEQQVAEQKRRESEQALNDEIYKEAQKKVDDGEFKTLSAARDSILEQRRSVGASAPEQAPDTPVDPAKAPVPLPPGHPNAQKGGLGSTAPEAPLVPPPGLADSLTARSGDNMPRTLQERLPANPNYQAPAGPRTLPETPGSGKDIVATPLGGQPQFITGPDGKIYVRQK